MTDLPIAGWYPDPKNSAELWRWWDGRAWTDDTALRPGMPVPPSPAPVSNRPRDWGWDTPRETEATPAEVPAARTRGERPARVAGVNGSTGWAWLLAFSPIGYPAVAGGLAVGGMLLLGTDQTLVPIIVGVAALVALIPLVAFADLDGRALRARELPSASSLWVILLTPVVYFIARAIALRGSGARWPGPVVMLVIVLVLLAGAAGAAVLFGNALLAVLLPGAPSLF